MRKETLGSGPPPVQTCVENPPFAGRQRGLGSERAVAGTLPLPGKEGFRSRARLSGLREPSFSQEGTGSHLRLGWARMGSFFYCRKGTSSISGMGGWVMGHFPPPGGAEFQNLAPEDGSPLPGLAAVLSPVPVVGLKATSLCQMEQGTRSWL